MLRWAMRLLKFLLASATSQLATQVALWALTLAVAGKWLADRSIDGFLFGAGAIAVVTLGAGFVVALLENWHEGFTIVKRVNHLYIYSRGTRQRYTVEFTIRSRTKSLTACEIPMQWTGASRIALANCSKLNPQDGTYEISEISNQEPGGDGAVDIVFKLLPPVGWFRKRKVGVQLEFRELPGGYQPYISQDPRTFCWSPFASLKFRLTWDDETVALNSDRVRAAAYRCGWARVRASQPALTRWNSASLKTLSGPVGRELRIFPVRTDRWYILEFDKAEGKARPRRPRKSTPAHRPHTLGPSESG